MNETTPQHIIDDSAYKKYVKTESPAYEEVSDPAHLSREHRKEALRLLQLQASDFGHYIPDAYPDTYIDENGEEVLDTTPTAVINGMILGETLIEPGYDEIREENLLPKLLELVNEEKFQLAVKAAQELQTGLKVPDDLHTRILNRLMQFSPERITDIFSQMSKPTLVIVPRNKFDEKLVEMCRNSHFTNQKEVFVDATSQREYLRRSPKRGKDRVCIIDGDPHPICRKGSPANVKEFLKFEEQRTANRNMDFIGPNRAIVLLQQSLIEAEQAGGDINKIVDVDTKTLLKPARLMKPHDSPLANLSFSLKDRRAQINKVYENDLSVRARASVDILEV